jgi:FtsZ-binding cell division protein ZapB
LEIFEEQLKDAQTERATLEIENERLRQEKRNICEKLKYLCEEKE